MNSRASSWEVEGGSEGRKAAMQSTASLWRVRESESLCEDADNTLALGRGDLHG